MTNLLTVPPPRPPSHGHMTRGVFWLKMARVMLLLFIFLVGIRGMGTGFKGLGSGVLESFFQATSNPFVGLVVGILATTLVQSSSVTTAMIVALVAAPDNPLPVPNAIPMIMGANIGTTVTNTIVSMGHISRPEEFRRAFAAATCHDFFNFITVAILLPLELLFGVLSKPAFALAGLLGTGSGGKLPNPLKAATKVALSPIHDGVKALFEAPGARAIALILISAVIIFVTLGWIVRTLRELATTRLQLYVARSLDSSGWVGIIVGIVITVMVQSSSVTTSVLVPLAGAGVITLRQLFPITLGANIGTTVTALIASMAASGDMAVSAVEVALVHLMFNLVGMLLIYPLQATRNIPLRMAEWLSEVAVRSKKHALMYVVGLFYGVPALLVFVFKYL